MTAIRTGNKEVNRKVSDWLRRGKEEKNITETRSKTICENNRFQNIIGGSRVEFKQQQKITMT